VSVGIAAIEYAVPEWVVSLEELRERGLLESDVAVLRRFGFQGARVARGPVFDLARTALDRLLAASGVAPHTIDLLVSTTALNSSVELPRVCETASERYRALCTSFGQRLLSDCALDGAVHLGVGAVSCTSLLAAMRTAAALLETTPEWSRAVCVTADAVPDGVAREVIYNVVSDGACAVLLEKGSPRNELVGFWQASRGFFWDTWTTADTLVANYFPVSRRFVLDGLRAHGVRMADVDLVLPHNVSLSSWTVLAKSLDLPLEKLFADNLGSYAHTLSADSVVNLRDAIDAGRLRPDQLALLFSFGLGGHWAAALVRH
jgi:3-oxoacyl-[acyl-carrier-protein] synthase-3